MSDLSIQRVNDVYIRITDAEPDIRQEISDHFTFEVPNAKFHPLVRQKKWDGKLRLFHPVSGTLYVGLKGYLEHFCEVNNYTINYEKWVEQSDIVTREQVVDFCKNLNLSLPGNQTIRDYQLDAIYRAIVDGRRLLLSPTGSGKSLIIYCLIRWHEQFDRQQLVLVPTTSLVHQMHTDFESYSKNNGWNVKEKCVMIHAGHEKINDRTVTISTWQSVYKLSKDWYNNFSVCFGDECHLFQSKSLTNIMQKMVNTPFRYGTTGTLSGMKTHKLVIEGLFGPVYKVTTTKELMDKKQLASLNIYCLILEYSKEVRKNNKDAKYPDEIDFLVQYEQRNKFIRNLTLEQKNNTLVLFQFVEKHGKILYDMIKSKEPDRKVFFVYGGTDAEQREDIRKITESEQNAIIVASYGTFSAGINIVNLHTVIFASPSKSRIRNLQSIGRGLRKGGEKVTCTLYDIGDDMTWNTRKNYTLLHMIERLKIYNDEQFDYRIVKVPLQ